MAALLDPERISRTRASPSPSIEFAGLASSHAAKGASLAHSVLHSSAPSVGLPWPSSGSIAVVRSRAIAPAQAGLRPSTSDNGRPASMRDRGSPATSCALMVRSWAAIAKYSDSLRLSAASARESKAARRQRAK
jgi:hypothetical protein